MIRAIYFDAVGTLIHPSPGAAEVYAEVGRRWGGRYSVEDIRQRFPAALQRQDAIDLAHDWATSEIREWRRWRDIVAEVLDDVPRLNVCFAELYVHFARPHAWTLAQDAEPLFEHLRQRGLTLGLASNYDQRLRSVVEGLPPWARLANVTISSEVGWRKPSAKFFEAVCRQAKLPPEQILYVGDDRVNDYDAARAAGLHALLVEPQSSSASGTILRLSELLELLSNPVQPA